MPASGDPVVAADISSLTSYTTTRPLVRLVAQSTQSIANNTNTAITFGVGSEDIDTHNYHDTASNTSRVTPTLAGYYECFGTIMFGARSDYTNTNAWIRKNGVSNLAGGTRNGAGTASQVYTQVAFAIVSCDGVSDYVELVGNQSNGAAAAQLTNNSTQFSCCFEVRYLRPL